MEHTYRSDRSEIRTRATEVTGALNQRLRPLGHPAMVSVRVLTGVTEIGINLRFCIDLKHFGANYLLFCQVWC